MNKSAKKSPKKVKTASSPNADTLVLNEPFFSSKRLFWIIGLVAFFVFANSISNGYNLDDELVTQNHPLTSRGLEAIGDIFTSPYYSDEMGYAYGYRPMVHLSFALEHQFFGEKASVSHFFNVILFALSAMLFFKFLLKLAGEKQLLFSLLATVLFVVHPIHTEVVDSIKNRDEILAFLFVILSGISILKFSKYGNLKSLIFVFIFFTCAMLSKKSVFPMVFVIPLLLVLSNDLTLSKLILMLVVLIFPGAIVAGELDLFKTLIFAILPFVVIIPFYYLKIKLLTLSDFSSKITFIKQLLPFLVAIITAFFAVYFNQFYLTIISLFFGVWALKEDTKWGVFLLTFLLMGFDWRFQSNHFALMAIFISTSYSFSIYFRTKKIDFQVLFFLFSIFYFLVISQSLLEVGFAVDIVLFCFLLVWRAVYSLVFSLIVLVVWALFFKLEGGFLPFAFLVASLAYFIHKFYPKINFYALQLLFFSAILTIQFGISNQLFTNVSPQVKSISLGAFSKEYNNVQLQNSVLKEGRFLEYIENTLVAPHSTTETIGTGVQTLGEYLKLMVFPYELSFYYGYSKTSTVDLKNLWVWVSIFCHLFLVFLAFWHINKRPLVTVGIAWYLFSIVLFSNWIELVAGMVGERLAFTASAGFCIFFVAIIFWIRPSFSFRKPGWIEFAFSLVIILFLVKTVSRNSQWKNHLSLMKIDINHLSNSAQAHNLYASNLMKYASLDSSLSEAERIAYQKEATLHFKKSVAIFPYFFNTQFDKARASIMVGDTVAAIDGYKKAIQIDPSFSDPYFYLLNIFALQKAEKPYLKLAKLLGANYTNFKLVDDRNKASLLLKDTSNLIASFKTQKAAVKSLLNNSLDSEAYFDLLAVYAQQNRGKEYLNTAKELSRIYNKSDLYEALAKGYFMTNQIDSAIYVLKQGILLHPNVQSLKDNLREVEKYR